MLFGRLGAAWAGYKKLLEQELRTLVVDDEPVICDILQRLLVYDGFAVVSVGNAEDAWQRMQAECFDLVVVDKNLPGASGLDLITQIRQAHMDMPVVLITAYPSASSISEALERGASDYLEKPFVNLQHVGQRFRSVLEQRVAERLYLRVVKDFILALEREGDEQKQAQAVARELLHYKRQLQAHAAVVLITSSAGVGELTSDALEACGLSVHMSFSVDDAKLYLQQGDEPLAAVVDLRVQGAADFIHEVRTEFPLVDVLALNYGADVHTVLKAIEGGASDIVNRSVEGMDILQARAERLVLRSYRQRVYLHLMRLMSQGTELDHKNAGPFFAEVLPESLRGLLDMHEVVVTGSENTDTEPVDPAEIFDETSSTRRLPRIAIRLPVRMQDRAVPPKSLQGETRDVSSGGLFIEATEVLPVGTRVRLELADPHSIAERLVHANAEVVRYVRVDPDPRGDSGVGVRIIGSADDYERLVQRLLGDDD